MLVIVYSQLANCYMARSCNAGSAATRHEAPGIGCHPERMALGCSETRADTDREKARPPAWISDVSNPEGQKFLSGVL